MSTTEVEISAIMPSFLMGSGKYSKVDSIHIGYEVVPGTQFSRYVYAHCLTLIDEPEPTRWQKVKAWASGLWGKKA